MKAHPEAERFPLMTGNDWTTFVEDVRANGVLEAVVIHDEMILDGRNRWKAAGETGCFVPAVTYDGNDPRGFVVSLNVARRHLTTKQRAAYAAELANVANGSNQHGKREGVQKSTPTNGEPMTLQQAADMLNVSRAKVAEAKKTMREDPVQHERDKRGEKKATKKTTQTKTDSPTANERNLNESVKHDDVPAVIPEPEAGPEKDELPNEEQAAHKINAVFTVALNRLPNELKPPFMDAVSLVNRSLTTWCRRIAKVYAEARIEKATRSLRDELAQYRFMEHQWRRVIEEDRLSKQPVEQFWTLEEYRKIRSALHPDREPSKEKLDEAYQLFSKVDAAFEKVKRREVGIAKAAATRAAKKTATNASEAV